MAPLRAPFCLAALALATCSADASPPEAAAGAPRRAVLVELFSSEGCSSCPPADAVLRRLARDQPVAGAEVVALELHVDYWNDLGWADPFSSPAFSQRQRGYAGAFGRRGVYTPQLVVDGASELNGSLESEAQKTIRTAAAAPKLDVGLERDGTKFVVTIARPASASGADVYFAVTESDLTTAVPRGENRGSTLAHGPVVRALRRLGSVGATAFRASADATVPGVRPERAHAVAFVQRPSDMRVLGVAEAPVVPQPMSSR